MSVREDAKLRRTLIAGSEQDFMLVRGLRLSGTQRQIGAAIAAEVHRSFPRMVGTQPDPLLRRARRRWFEIHWPEHAERVLGFADALGVDPADESLELLDLVGIPVGVGCSARPSWNVQAGVHELQLSRFLLDRCATVDEAVVALHLAKQYDQSATCHYLVADRHGDAFVWERDMHNAEHVVRATDGPLCVTNYLLHRHPDPDALPVDDPERGDMYARARSLQTFAGGRERLHAADLDEALDAVGLRMRPAIARTLWHTTYDLEARAMTIDFYLGDDAAGEPRRSDVATFCAAAGAS